MALQNRVMPTGEIVSDPRRGLMMGNRGCIHRPDRTLGAARWRSKAWICCTLDWKGVRRDPMPPGRWTALFFLDEATSLAAGHRPCGYCRRADFDSFIDAWPRAEGRGKPRAPEIDARLHTERVEPRSRCQRTRRAAIAGLPDGTMVRYGAVLGLVAGGRILPWSFAGYGVPIQAHPDTTLDLLTPPSSVAALAAGYRPMLHPTAVRSDFTERG